MSQWPNYRSTAITFVGGFYHARVKHYIRDRLEEVKVKLEQERAVQDRYDNEYFNIYNVTQNYLIVEGIDFNKRKMCVFALLPTLSEQILD
jgi:glutaredoxin 2